MDLALVYMLGGMSSRFGGRIKGLVKIREKETLMDVSLAQAIPHGFSKIILIVSPLTSEPFKEHFGSFFNGIPISYAMQNYDLKFRDKPWGTADALCSAHSFLNCAFVVCNGDDLYGSRTFKVLAEHLTKNNDSASIGYRLSDNIPESGSVNRGIFKTDAEGDIIRIDEIIGIKKDSLSEKNLTGNELCSMNIFALQPIVADLLAEHVSAFKEKHAQDRKIECYLPVELNNMLSQGLKLKLYPNKDRWMGITNPGDEEDIRRELQLANQ